MKEDNNLNRIYKYLDKYRVYAPFLALAVLSIIIGALRPRFFGYFNVYNILKQASVPLILAIGETLIIKMGSIDLSVEGIMAIGSVLLSFLVLNPSTSLNLGFFGIIITIILTALIGLLNGIIHTKAQIPSFITTLGMGAIMTGTAILLYQGEPVQILDQQLRNWVIGSVFGIPNIFLVAIFALISVFALSKLTRFGTYIDAIGGDEEIANLSGISIDRYKIYAFSLAGLCYGLGGAMNSLLLGVGSARVGSGLLLNVIAAVVIGGTAMSGGVGSVLQTLAGVLIIVVLQNGMILLNINQYLHTTVTGLVIIGAVAATIDRSSSAVIK